MKTAALFALTLCASLTAFGDFSYTSTQKTTGGTMGAMIGAAGDRVSKIYWKGTKMASSSADTTLIIDMSALTMTTINNKQKTYTVKKFGDLVGPAGAKMEMSVDVKETGQKKSVNGFNASETIFTMGMDMDLGAGGTSMKMQVELDMWISPDVPGAAEMRDFYKKFAADLPWGAMMGAGGNQSIQKAMAEMQRKMGDLNGVAVEQVMRMKQVGGAPMPQMPQMSADQMAQMQAAMSKMSPAQQAQMQSMMGAMGRERLAAGDDFGYDRVFDRERAGFGV